MISSVVVDELRSKVDQNEREVVEDNNNIDSMAPSIVNSNEEDNVLNAEIMKAIRNSLKELNIESPSRPSRPPPGAVAAEDDFEASEDEDEVSMITKASEIERDIQESLRVVRVIKDDNNPEEEDDEANNTDQDEVSEATLASDDISKISKKSIKAQKLKKAIESSLADLSQCSTPCKSTASSQQQQQRPLTPTPTPIVSRRKKDREGLYRPIIIDGSSMGFAYANHDRFCAEGLRIAYECFKSLGYDDDNIVIIFKHIPEHYKSGHDQAIIDFYHKLGVLHYCPSRYAGDVLIKSNDDLFILKTAAELEGVVLSSDRYREYWELYPEYRDVIMNRLIQPTFIKDQLILPLDPLGDQGPELDQVLRFGVELINNGGTSSAEVVEYKV